MNPCKFEFTRIDMHTGEFPYIAVLFYDEDLMVNHRLLGTRFICDDLPF